MRTACVAIIEYNGRILLAKKKHAPGHFLSDQWHIPGGKVKQNESHEETLLREMKEEACIIITVDRLLAKSIDHFKGETKNVYWYICKTNTDMVTAGSDVAEVKFVQKQDVRSMCSKTVQEQWPDNVINYFSS